MKHLKNQDGALQQTLLFAEGSHDGHVNHIAQQENGKARTMKDISFHKCLESLKKSNHDGLLAKMFVDLLVGMKGWYSTRCTLTWKAKDMRYNRFLFQLQASTLPTNDSEFGLLPTPTAYDWNTARTEETFIAAQARHKAKGVNLQNPLKQMAKLGMLPTPCTRDYKGDRTLTDGKNITRSGQEMGLSLEQSARILNGTPNLTSANSQLNPLFVESMMGFPANWTLLPFLIGESNQ